MTITNAAYPARFDIDYPERLDRVSTALRALYAIPIVVLISLLTATGNETVVTETGEQVTTSGGGIAGGLFAATMFMIVFRMKYPRWWFAFFRELTRFGARVGSYLFLLTDRYPSTDEEQSVHLDVVYPDVERELNRWLPLVKWMLAIPHYFLLAVLTLGALLVTVIAWFAILFTGRYPRGLFDYTVGVGRWALRVNAYAFMLTTDRYPPFSLD